MPLFIHLYEKSCTTDNHKVAPTNRWCFTDNVRFRGALPLPNLPQIARGVAIRTLAVCPPVIPRALDPSLTRPRESDMHMTRDATRGAKKVKKIRASADKVAGKAT